MACEDYKYGDSEWDLLRKILGCQVANGGGGGGGGNVNITGVNGVAPSVGNGASDAGTIRVTVANDSTGVVGLNAGTNIVGKVGIDQTTPGTTNAVSVAQLGANTVSTGNGVSGTGVLRVAQVSDGTGVLASVGTISTSVTPGTAAANLGKAEDAAHASGDTGVFVLGVSNEAQSTRNADSDYSIIATDTKGNSLVVGNLANDAVDAGNPIKIGGKARTSVPTAVADSDRVDASFDKFGRLIVQHGIRDIRAQQITTITSSTAETTIVTADATYMRDLYGLILTNTGTSDSSVAIKDSTAGTTRITFMVPAGETRGFMLPACDGHKQAAVNNNWTATCGTSTASMIITAFTVGNPS